MDLTRIEELLDLVARSRIAELEITENGTRIRIVKGQPGAAVAEVASPPAERAAPPATSAPAAASAAAEIEICAPTYGVFHRAPAPGAPPFTELGARVEAGQAVCVVEAMKTFIRIEAEAAGTVLAILAENASEVEAGQPLLRIGLDAAAA